MFRLYKGNSGCGLIRAQKTFLEGDRGLSPVPSRQWCRTRCQISLLVAVCRKDGALIHFYVSTCAFCPCFCAFQLFISRLISPLSPPPHKPPFRSLSAFSCFSLLLQVFFFSSVQSRRRCRIGEKENPKTPGLPTERPAFENNFPRQTIH